MKAVGVSKTPSFSFRVHLIPNLKYRVKCDWLVYCSARLIEEVVKLAPFMECPNDEAHLKAAAGTIVDRRAGVTPNWVQFGIRDSATCAVETQSRRA